MFVDSHCHLNFPDLRDHIPAIRQAMAEARVERALVISTTPSGVSMKSKVSPCRHP